MSEKFFLEGYIRAKLGYPLLPSDRYHWYFDNHNKFNFEAQQNSWKIKSSEFVDEDRDISYLFTFGYDELGIKFTVVNRKERIDNISRISIFKFSLDRAVKGYRAFKDHFLNEICPDSLKLEFIEQNLVINLFGFFNGLNIKEQNTLMKEMRSCLKKYTSNLKFFLISENLKDYSDVEVAKVLSPMKIEELSRFDFDTISIIVNRIYLFVDHHLFARYFFLEDTSLGLLNVANWGFFCSLKLHDIHFELEDYGINVNKAEENLNNIKKQCYPIGIDAQRENLILLEKKRVLLEDDLREYLTLADKIYDGLNKYKHYEKVYNLLRIMRSLPHTLYQAYGILSVSRLGGLSNHKIILENMNSDLRIIEIKNKRIEIIITSLILVGLFIILHLLKVYYGNLVDVGYLADILQILTFIVAMIIMVTRVWK